MTQLKPMPFGLSLFYFGVPTLLFCLAFYVLRPYLSAIGLSPILALLSALSTMLAFLLVATVVACKKEEQVNWIRRLRLNNFSWRFLLWGLASFVGIIIAAQIMTPITGLIIDTGSLPLPENIPTYIDPRVEQTPESFAVMLSENDRGSVLLVAGIVMLLIFNVFAEELWWRGYVLPRQELAFGNVTWFVHGLLWTVFHLAQYWTILILLPACLLISWVAQRTQSSWPGIFSHFLINAIGLVPIFLTIL